jgi:hypothetical protein
MTLILDPRAEFLRGMESNVTSQYGEDGLIAETFKKLGTTNKWCFEVGAADGVHLSNTVALRADGWRAVLIECNEHEYCKLRALESPTVQCYHARIKPGQDGRPGLLDGILEHAGVPEQPDFGVIDIDGQDYWILESLRRLPRVLLIEYRRAGDTRVPRRGGSPEDGQAGLDDIKALGEQRGYAALVRTGCNVLMCKEGLI